MNFEKMVSYTYKWYHIQYNSNDGKNVEFIFRKFVLHYNIEYVKKIRELNFNEIIVYI